MSSKAWVSALRMLAARSLSEAQLRERLRRRQYPEDEIDTVLHKAVAERLIDDARYAEMHILNSLRAVGRRRVLGQLTKKGIDREVALSAVARVGFDEAEQLAAAFAKLTRTRPGISLSSAARSLHRLGFDTGAIYAYLKTRGDSFFGVDDAQAGTLEDSD